MSDHNPYAAPLSDISVLGGSSDAPFAPRLHRFGAALLDGIILFPVNYLLSRLFIKIPDQAEISKRIMSGESIDSISSSIQPGLLTQLLMSALILGAYIGINWVFLKNGQTLGKKAAGIQIRKRSGELFEVKDLIMRRVLPLQLVAILLYQISPMVGGIVMLVNALCVFRPGHNALHDDVAGSKVVKMYA